MWRRPTGSASQDGRNDSVAPIWQSTVARFRRTDLATDVAGCGAGRHLWLQVREWLLPDIRSLASDDVRVADVRVGPKGRSLAA
jgi:hypothetical protein